MVKRVKTGKQILSGRLTAGHLVGAAWSCMSEKVLGLGSGPAGVGVRGKEAVQIWSGYQP